jgi:YfiH family protein
VRNIVSMQQVHGNNVVLVDRKNIGQEIPRCDGLITNDPKVTLGIKTADCLPIFIVDKKTKSIGLVHAGWRGLYKGIIGKAIFLMDKKFGVRPEDLQVFIGAHICPRHYEVKDDVSGKFEDYTGAVIKKGEKKYLDLGKVAEIQLIKVGINKKNIKADSRCTFENKVFFSYRRNHTKERNFYTLSLS